MLKARVLAIFLTGLFGSGALASEIQKTAQVGDTRVSWTYANDSDRDASKPRVISISSPLYRELQMDLDADGAMDVREVSTSNLRLRFMFASSQGFLRLEVSQRTQKGFVKGEFVLAHDGSHYRFIRKHFVPFEVMTDPCAPPVNGNKPGSSIDREMRLLGISAIVDPSCRKEPFDRSYDGILAGIDQVFSGKENSQPYLACLRDHYMGYYANKVTDEFVQASDPAHSEFVVACEKGDPGIMGSFDSEAGKIYLNQPDLSDYGEVFLHESLHRAGIRDEQTVVKIVECCVHSKSCSEMDEMVKDEIRKAAAITVSERLPGFSDFWDGIRSNSDPETVDAMYDDYLNLFKDKFKDVRPDMDKCQSSGKNIDRCRNEIASQVALTSMQEACMAHFQQKPTKERKEFCTGISTRYKDEVVVRNATQSCDGKAVQSFSDSCMRSALKEMKTMKEQFFSGAPEVAGIPPILVWGTTPDTQAERNKLMNSFLRGLQLNIPGSQQFWTNLKETAGIDRATGMMSSLFETLVDPAQKGEESKFRVAACLKSGKSPEYCAKQIRTYVGLRIQNFFGKSCPNYFTLEENAKNPCARFQKDFSNLLLGSIDNGCKPSPQDKPELQSGNINFNCISRALNQAQDCYAHFDSREDCKADKSTFSMLMAGAAPVEMEKEANEAANVKTDIDKINSPSGRSVVSFRPEDLGNVANVLREKNQSNTSVAHYAQRAMENVIPSAHADVSIPNPDYPRNVPQSSAKKKVTTSTSTRTKNTQTTHPSSNAPFTTVGAMSTPSGKSEDKVSSSKNFPSSLGSTSNGIPDSGSNAASTSDRTPKNQATQARSRKSAPPSSPKRSPSVGKNQGIATAQAERPSSTTPNHDGRKGLLSYLKANPQKAWERAQKGELTGDLEQFDIQLLDESDEPIGSSQPVCRFKWTGKEFEDRTAGKCRE